MNSSFIFEFLSLFDDKLWNKKKAELSAIRKPAKTSEIPNTEGYVNLFNLFYLIFNFFIVGY